MPDTPTGDEPLARLERAFIDEFLRSWGYTEDVLRRLPRRTAEEAVAEAAEAASLLLAQIESRVQNVTALRPGRPPRRGR